jgi:ABC-type transport system involved in multi-copper enzyme maturation permease subunit
MKRLLSIEFQKLYKNRASKFLIATYFVLLSFIALIASIKFEIGTFRLHIAEQGIFNFPFIWHFNTFMASIFKLFLAIVIVSMMANEYSYGTLKQNLIDGLSKKEFVISKFLILGYSFSSYTELSIVFSDLEYLLAYFVKLIGFFSFCLFLGILIKRSAFALGFLLVWYIFENIVSGLLRWQIFPRTDIYQSIDQFFPLEAMSNLIKAPFTRFSAIKNIETTISGEEIVRDFGVHSGEIIIVLIWTLIFIYLSFWIVKKRDL